MFCLVWSIVTYFPYWIFLESILAVAAHLLRNTSIIKIQISNEAKVVSQKYLIHFLKLMISECAQYSYIEYTPALSYTQMLIISLFRASIYVISIKLCTQNCVCII